MLRQTARDGRARSSFVPLTRADFFAGLFILGCANGLIAPIAQSIAELGWMGAVFSTFNISVIVLVACISGVSLISRDRMDQLRSTDVAVGTVFLMLVILPVGQLSWVAVAALSLYILLFTVPNESARRGAIILLATTVPMLWSKLLFHFFAKFILELDASLVSWELGTRRTGNMVQFADHSADLVILPACSSLANVSLAILCWITLSQLTQHRWRFQDLMWCLLACVSVIAVNVTRMSLMGLSISHYNAIHSQTGDVITNWIILILTVGISVVGLKREIFTRS
ncbi:MAG: hypothetical protein QOE73_2496 [Verrucomicrobiota bacterium]|jgi:hypothetical protein